LISSGEYTINQQLLRKFTEQYKEYVGNTATSVYMVRENHDQLLQRICLAQHFDYSGFRVLNED